MFYQIKLQKIILVISFGLLMSVGTYFFIPPVEKAFSCEVNNIKGALRDCLDGAIVGGNGYVMLNC